MNITVSLIIPFYNEAQILPHTIDCLLKYREKNLKNCEIIFADDGSTDCSAPIIRDLTKNKKHITVVQNPVNMGRGEAIRRAMLTAKGNIIGYLDADLEISETYILPMIRCLHDADAVIASKFAHGAHTRTSLVRKIPSILFNWMIRKILSTNISDHQAGCKFFKREVISAVLPLTNQYGWLFDIEMLYGARQHSFTIEEFPISVAYGRGSIHPSFVFDFLRLPGVLLNLKRNTHENIQKNPDHRRSRIHRTPSD